MFITASGSFSSLAWRMNLKIKEWKIQMYEYKNKRFLKVVSEINQYLKAEKT